LVRLSFQSCGIDLFVNTFFIRTRGSFFAQNLRTIEAENP